MRGDDDRDTPSEPSMFGKEVIEMGKNNSGLGTRATRAGQLIAGLRKNFTNGGTTLTFAGGTATVTVDAAVAQLQKLIDNRAATTAAQATARDKVQTEQAQMPALDAFMSALEAFIRVTLGADTTVLAGFGLAPRKAPAPKTATEKAVAAAKAKATRAARGTKGTKAIQAVKGSITASLVVTPTTTVPVAPEAPAPGTPAAPGGATVAPPKG